VLVFNNMNYGMTGGQHSATTPLGAITATTPGGNLERPLDICATASVNGASYVYRGTSFDTDLADRIADGIRQPGFAVLDIWELCTAYFVPRNKLNRKVLFETLQELEFPTGVLHQRGAPEYAASLRAAGEKERGAPTLVVRPIEPKYAATLDRRYSMVIAGSAGGRVGSAARLLARAGILSGLYAAQRNDYPVTVKTGHSTSELILGPTPIDYAGVTNPDLLLVLSADGKKQARRYLAQMDAEGEVLALAECLPLETRARVTTMDFAAAGLKLQASQHALAAVALAAARFGLVPAPALDEAVRQGEAEHVEANLKAIEAGRAIASA
jgi:Pyruvate/2-oxoacid:ferredoxin oxidoreductase gamma subunit